MLNYIKYCAICFVLIVLVVILNIFFSFSLLLIVPVIVAFTTVLVVGSVKIGSGVYVKTMCKRKNKTNCVSLTFDDGPDAINTPLVLKILEKNNIKACFFCIGKNIEKNPELLKEINNKEHIIGNHTYSHSGKFDFYSVKKMTDEIIKTNNIIYNTVNKEVKLFRPPYGVTNPNLAKAIKKCKLTTIGWSLRSFDTTAKGNITNTIKRLEKIKGGDIVLLHDRLPEATEILIKLIDIIKRKNLKIVRLDELLDISNN